ncbi:MAG: hypothetical protein ACOYXM_17810 [Actinomycetota bacterium]
MERVGTDTPKWRVLEAVADDLDILQRVPAVRTAYNKTWLAEQFRDGHGITISLGTAKNFLSGTHFPVRRHVAAGYLSAIQAVLNAAFDQERPPGESSPHQYLDLLEGLPPPASRRARFPPSPKDSEAPDDQPTPSARIDELFRRAASDLQQDRVNQHLQDVLREANSIDDRAMQQAIRARAYAARAVEANTSSERRKWWNEALRASRRELAVSADVDAVLRCVALVVDATSDRFAELEPKQSHRELANVARDIDEALDRSNDPPPRSALLAAKAAVLRHQGTHEPAPSRRNRFFDESVRCAELAVREHPLPASVLELGLCMSQRSGTEKSERRQEMLRKAEEHLIRAVERGAGEVGRLALATFYRHQHRPLDAVDAFPLDAPHANYRRILRAAPVFAEAAIELHYNGYPHDVVERNLEDARVLLDSARRGGYGWARHLSDLAVVRAVLDGPSSNDSALAGIFDEAGGTDWTHAAELAADPGKSVAQQSWALGIDDSAVWNRLGTYALDFLDDDVLAERFYRQSMRVGPNSYLPSTNLARLLIGRGSTSDLEQAWRLLDDVSGSSPPNFPWWRRERESLANAVAGLPPEERFPAPRPKPTRLAAKATAARSLDDPAEGREAVLELVDEFIEQCSLRRAGQLAVAYRDRVFRFDVLWCAQGASTDFSDLAVALDQVAQVLLVLSHAVDESTEAAVRDRFPGVEVVTAAEIDAVATGLEVLPALIARKALESSSVAS